MVAEMKVVRAFAGLQRPGRERRRLLTPLTVTIKGDGGTVVVPNQ